MDKIIQAMSWGLFTWREGAPANRVTRLEGLTHTPYSKMAAASDDLGRVARERGIEAHDSMFTCLHVVA